MRTQVDTSQKKKKKQTIDKNQVKTPCKEDSWLQNDNKLITKKTWDKRVVIFHKSTDDGGALAMMFGKDEEPQSSVVAHWKIVTTCACYRAMDMRYWY
jgi:hypothetical protein